MTTLMLLATSIAVVVIVLWSVVNDAVPPDKPTRGLLAMPDPRSEGAEASRRRGGTRR